MNEETIRADFEQFMSDDGKWPQAIERDGAGNYILSQSASSWHVWRNAYHQCLQSPEVQALRKDAERWKSMRQCFIGVEYDDPNTGMALFTCHIPQYAYRASDPNKIADAAMEQQK